MTQKDCPFALRSISRAALLVMMVVVAVALPTRAAGQPTPIRLRVKIEPCISFTKGVNCGEGANDLRLSRKIPGSVISPAGSVVTRTRKRPDGSTVSYQVRLDSALRSDTTVEARVWPGPIGTVYVDEDDRSIVHVNFWLAADTSKGGMVTRRTLTGPVRDTVVSRDSLRKIDYFFELANRQTIEFKASSWSVGATTIPFKVRFGRDNTTTISNDVNVNLYAGRTWSKLSYTYLENSSAEDNPMRIARSITLAASLGLSSTDVDSTTSSTAPTPLTTTHSVGVLSPGIAVLLRVHAIEVGLFGGIEHAIGRGSSSWDYNNRPWFGIGFGLNLFKLGGGGDS